MLKLNRILVPTDFSEAARASYAFGIELTRKYGGKVDLLHVIPTFKYLNESISRLGLPINLDKDIYPHMVTETEARLRQEFEEHIPEEQRGDAIVQVDLKASDAIVTLATERDADLVVMGATGSRGRDVIWGSTTEKVVRKCPVPVLAIPEGAVPDDIDHILVPSDYSELSFRALRGAVALANSLESEITLMHVIELYGSPLDNEPREKGKDQVTAVADKLAARLEAWAAQNPHFEITFVREGEKMYLISTRGGVEKKARLKIVVTKAVSAYSEIVEYANDNSDMVVITTHGRSGLSHLFLGSTTEKVVQATNKPVLTWRPQQHG
ncbi:MAG: universal stress protein [Bacteroidetes bacterium]|nr:universal stress protein [Bacteroidota bacterium]MCH8524836.1 universal stress protein [Balneolales bacterium]